MRNRLSRPWRILRAAATVALASALLVTIRAEQVAPPAAAARPLTFTRDIAPIAFEQCVYCHRPGEVAPFSFLSYKDVRPWAHRRPAI